MSKFAGNNMLLGMRTSLVTGGTEGIGRAVALNLARNGDRVIIVGRNRDNGAAVLRELERAGRRGRCEHRFLEADLLLLRETSRVARMIDEVDNVVCCAGILSTIPEWTSEDLERTFALNYLSRYLLIRQLLPRLERSPSGGRVVLVANAGVYKDTIDFEDLHYRRGKRGLNVSARSQVANDLFAIELAERVLGSNIRVSCVYPGLVRTRVFDNARGLPWIFKLLQPIVRIFTITPEVAAETPVFLTTAEHGGFWGPRCSKRKTPLHPKERRRALWSASSDLVTPYLTFEAVESANVVATDRALVGPSSV